MKSEFLESELELYVQRLLVHEFYSSGNRYRMLKISPSEERLKGYDAMIVGLTPFYCQFKTSDFVRRGNLRKSRDAFCKSRKWPTSPFYSFALRVPNDSSDKKNPKVWQHNVLHALWKSNPTAVAYVAPAFHTKTEMELLEPPQFYAGCIWHDHHYHCSNISIRKVAVNGRDRCRLPFFDRLISIPPHMPVKHLKHSYAFTSHRDITFHSDPESVENGRPFGEALELFVKSSSESKGLAGQREVEVGRIRSMLGDLGRDANFLNSFLAFGLFQAGLNAGDVGAKATRSWKTATWLQQHIALSASLQSYFGISTLGLLEVEEK
ncbi:MAG: hypothetical protein KF823_12245 [Xanthomonadales bacterium]|nr:hypothetical protein [Xanthomonadales bacterium]